MKQFVTDKAALRAICDTWNRTPWTADGAVKGTGVSCSCLPWAILNELGHNAPTPPARVGMKKAQIIPTMEGFMASHPELYLEVTEPLPGDVLMFDMGIGHMALFVDEDGTMIHAWQTDGVHYSNLREERLRSRLRRIWRPISP